MAADTFDIQELVNRSGVPRRTIYFYVQQGLIPAPQGAGLAAYYTEDHLLRLKLIPVLRGQGLRLDEIRRRFAEMSADEMRGQLQAAEEARRQPDQKESSPAPQPAPAPWLVREAKVGKPVLKEPAPAANITTQRFVHHSLPGGMVLIAPETLDPENRRRLDQLLQAAREIFHSPRSGETPSQDSANSEE